MKNKFSKKLMIYLIGFTLLSIYSCKKYIEVGSVSLYDLPTAFSSVSNAYSSLIGAYDELQGTSAYGLIISQYFPYDTDESYLTFNIDNGRRAVSRYVFGLNNTTIINPFRALYRGVEKANLCIEQIPLMEQYKNGTTADQFELRRMYGEALTLRAQYLFELIRNWGDVPAPMEPAYQRKDLFLPQTDRDSTYDKLLADLAIAKDLVPWRTQVKRDERITKGAIKAFRAKLALFRGGYSLRSNGQMQRPADYKRFYDTASLELADLLNNRTQHTLNPSFENVWRNLTTFTNDPSAEIIYQVAAGGNADNSDSRLGVFIGIQTDINSRYGQATPEVRETPNYFYAFDSVDIRRDLSITAFRISATNFKVARSGLGDLTCGKFRRDWRVPISLATLNLGYNWPLIRFSDVLLMYAEVLNELNNGATPAAIAAFEEVRKRAYGTNPIGTTPTSKNAFFDAVVNERLLEFGQEGIRKYDLIRWNLLAAKIAEARIKMDQIRDRTGPYVNVPQYLYYKNTGEEITWYTATDSVKGVPFYRPTQIPPTPVGTATNPAPRWVRINWAESLKGTAFDNVPLSVGLARFFTPGKSELIPYDQTVIDSYQGRLKQNPGY